MFTSILPHEMRAKTHYPQLGDLRASAEAGCRICCNLWTWVQELGVDLDKKNSWHLNKDGIKGGRWTFFLKESMPEAALRFAWVENEQQADKKWIEHEFAL